MSSWTWDSAGLSTIHNGFLAQWRWPSGSTRNARDEMHGDLLARRGQNVDYTPCQSCLVKVLILDGIALGPTALRPFRISKRESSRTLNCETLQYLLWAVTTNSRRHCEAYRPVHIMGGGYYSYVGVHMSSIIHPHDFSECPPSYELSGALCWTNTSGANGYGVYTSAYDSTNATKHALTRSQALASIEYQCPNVANNKVSFCSHFGFFQNDER